MVPKKYGLLDEEASPPRALPQPAAARTIVETILGEERPCSFCGIDIMIHDPPRADAVPGLLVIVYAMAVDGIDRLFFVAASDLDVRGWVEPGEEVPGYTVAETGTIVIACQPLRVVRF